VAAVNILQMSVSAGLLVVAIVIIRAVALNRLPKKMFLVLWGIALCRLLVPVSIQLRFSLYNAIGEIAKTVFPYNATPSVIGNIITMGGVGTTETVAQFNGATQVQGFQVAPATIIWIIGMVAAFIIFAAMYFRNHRELRFSTNINSNDFLNEWLDEHRLLRPITIAQSDRTMTSLAVGLIKPRIILPRSMGMNDKRLLGYVLTHEYYHIKRCDALWKLLLTFALCVHWFNPMVWVMFILVNRDLELACDEMVIRRFGMETKTAYAYTLIGLAEQRSKFAPLYNGFSRNAAEERIVSIMKIKRHSALAIVIAVLLIAGATTAFAAATATTAEQEQGEKFDLRTKERVDLETSADDSDPVTLDKSGGVIAYNDISTLKRDDGSGTEVIIGETADPNDVLFFDNLFDIKHDDGTGNEVTIGEQQ
jgi:beta-lactamase regulating signal transducer with metallopeptidase domain